ncbi:hypothetical protein [Alkalimarinus sediminis]|uniref:Uncharacterized protein n=1 Tax=Alkalimarinus sediminis TaxID=1632866 RepID=A0A9E8HRC8_9ALTE|nr:hypothetical protein [Alkalimarinus sediminis]UZW75071.1 hypothetical protein NNL22_00250 [Alkalimarinus sediminis]
MIDVPLARPLDKKAVQVANQRLYQQHPQLQGKLLDPDNPQHRTYMNDWREMYVEAGGPLKSVNASTDQHVNDPVQPCDCESQVQIVDIVYEPSTDRIYLLDANNLNAWMSEIQLLDDVMRPVMECKNEEELLEKKEEAVKQLVALGINPPTSEFGGGESKKLTEIVRLKGSRKYTYVRSEKMKDHARSYSLETDDRNRSKGYDPKTKRFNYKKMAKKVREELNKPEFKVKFKADNLLERFETYNEFQKFMNQFADSTEKQYWVGDDSTAYNVTAEAQFFRFSSGAAFHSELDPAEGKLLIAGGTHAELSFAEGQAKCQRLIPSKEGFHCQFELNNTPCDLGYFRLDLNLVLSGNAGASANLGGAIAFEMVDGQPAIKGAPRSEPNKSGKFKYDQLLREKGHVHGINAEAEFFAGVTAGCKVSIALQWQSPEDNQEFVVLAEAGAGVEVAAGIGGEANFSIEYDEKTQKFIVRFGAGVVAGVGATGKVDAAIEAGSIYQLVKFIYHQLMKAEFLTPVFIDVDDFDFLQGVLAKAIASGSDIVEESKAVIRDISSWWDEIHQSKAEAQGLAENILGDSSLFKFAAPMVKGRFLAILCRRFLLSTESRQEQAIIKLLSYTQCFTEYHEILKHMSESGAVLTSGEAKNAENMLNQILDGEEQIRFHTWKYRLKKRPNINSPVVAYAAPWQAKPVDDVRIAQLKAAENNCYQQRILA